MHPLVDEGERGRQLFCILEALSGERGEEERRMSYSCTNRGNSQDPSNAKNAAGNNPGRDTRGTDDSPKQAATMKVKKGCNSADVGVPVTTEEDLLTSAVVTPEDVLGLQKITESKFTVFVSVGACRRRTKVRKTPRLLPRHHICAAHEFIGPFHAHHHRSTLLPTGPVWSLLEPRESPR